MSTLDDRAKARARLRAAVFDAGGPAFPMHDTRELPVDNTVDEARLRRGMTLRDYFAGKALQGFCAGALAAGHTVDDEGLQKLTDAAVSAADSLIRSLAK